jgi:dihydropyrimidinase
MPDYDLIVRNAKIVTAERQSEGDIAVKDGKVAALGADVKGTATREIDAAGKFVLPGGVDSHCHIEQKSGMGVMCADDFYTGTVSAAFGGTTTVIPFAAQHRGMSLRQVVKDYHEAATPKAVIDYAFHLIITDPSPQALGQELPALIKDGYTSFKIYMTYDAMKVSDYQMLDILALARRDGALVMVHAENHDMISWLAHHLVDQGHVAPKFHAIAHARVAEAEATNRAISLARLVDAPLLIVHMSEIEAIETLRQAQKKGLKIFGETCPQYIALTADDMDKPGVEGAMWCCSPPPRDSAAQEAVWAALKDGTFQTFSSDHAPYQFNEKGKIPKGDKTTFKEMANGVASKCACRCCSPKVCRRAASPCSSSWP